MITINQKRLVNFLQKIWKKSIYIYSFIDMTIFILKKKQLKVPSGRSDEWFVYHKFSFFKLPSQKECDYPIYTSSIYFCHSNFPAADPATAPGGTTGTTSSSKGTGNAVGALALGGLAALALSQLGGGGLGGGYGGGYGGSISPREQLYLRQATAY